MSKTPLPLRRRVTLALTALGFVLSALFAAATIAVTEDYEYVLATEILRGQADDYGLRLSNGLPAQLPKTHRLSGYTRVDVPPHYTDFPLGVREDPANDSVHVGVFDTSAGRLYFTIDLNDIEALEVHLGWVLAGVVVTSTLLAGILGWYFAGTALMPLRRLAQAVDALPVVPRVSTLRAQVSRDELGQLAGAIDDYQQRLVDADAHEQAFFADASHELRTPIAVVQGAAEVMLDDVDAERDPRRLERLRRLDRGVREMTDLVEMLLTVARRRPLQFEAVDADAFLREVVDSLQSDATPHAADIAFDASGALRMPRREALLLLRHAIGKLGWPSSGQALSLRFDGGRLDIATRAHDGTSASSMRSDVGGMGALAQRLVERLGWRCEQASPGHIVLLVPASTMDETWTSG